MAPLSTFDRFDLLPEHLYKYNDAELIVGHTAKYPDLHNRAATQVQDDWSDKLVMVGDPNRRLYSGASTMSAQPASRMLSVAKYTLTSSP